MPRIEMLRIKTPEGIVFAMPLASPVTRFLAWSIDIACVAFASMLVGFLFSVLRLLSPNLATALSTLATFVLSVGYAMITEWHWRGQTVGKRLLRLRVVDAEGLRLTFNQVALRNLLRFIDMLPLCYLVGGLACLFSARGQRLGDLAANTVVVRNPRLSEPDLDQILAGKYNSLRDHPHLAARLRQRISASEAALALQAVLRRDLLDADERVKLFDQLAEHFRSKVSFPAAASEGIANEQFVRNVTDLLYAKRESRAATEPSSSPHPSYAQR